MRAFHFLTATSETSPKSLQVAEPSSEKRVVAKQLLGHVLLDYGILWISVMCCFATLLLFFVSPYLLRPSRRQMEHSGRLLECFKRVAELNSLHFIHGLKIAEVSGGAAIRLIQVRLSRTVLMDCLDRDATLTPFSVTF